MGASLADGPHQDREIPGVDLAEPAGNVTGTGSTTDWIAAEATGSRALVPGTIRPRVAKVSLREEPACT